jgi:two-component system CheB/CheR fusion protein
MTMAKPSGHKHAINRTAVKRGLKGSPQHGTESVRPGAPFPIVGIGASAGGLEALEQFLRHVPERIGMAFVIVQHLDPTRKGILAALLQRSTTMSVVQVKDHTKVRPDCVYVIPPDKDMSILHGVLHLRAPAEPRGLRLPVDFFLRSLADDSHDLAIGVILSGMGSDGTLGLAAIKESAGVVFVQEPASAKFDGMPRSAIEAGLADFVAPPAELPGKIAAYLHHKPLITDTGPGTDTKGQTGVEKILLLLRAHTGHDFCLYKKTSVVRRIERRMGIHRIDKMADYVLYLRENPHELELLFKELLIGVTNFFRDPAAWEQLKNEVLPALLAGRSPTQTLRAWVPACASGEEAYSLGIVYKELHEQLKLPKTSALQIFATDLDRDAIAKARQAFYPPNIVADVSPERLSRFFVKTEHGYQVTKAIREMVIFAPQNLVMDPPFSKLDILSCRNLLIYLTPDLQKKLMPVFHFALNPRGILFLGSAETAGTFANLFSPFKGKSQLYQRLSSPHAAQPVVFPVSFSPDDPRAPERRTPVEPAPSVENMAGHFLLARYTPAAALVNDKGDIFYISGRTGKYLEPAAGKANLNIFAMAREGLRLELSAAFRRAVREKRVVTLNNVKIGTNGGTQVVNVTVEAISEPEALRGMVMIVFTDVVATLKEDKPGKAGRSPTVNAQSVRMRQELEQTRQELQTFREEMQTSQEELQSSNEEYQSTNEELTTSKEEMQSLNEELQTVNQELQAKVDDLTRANNDMKNLLDSTEIATVFLDQELRVGRFTVPATAIINLIPTDAGRPITDITTNLRYPELAADARDVMRTLAFSEKAVATSDGRWFLVRIMPYRTLDNRIDGVVITFVDITESKAIEAELRKRQNALEIRVKKHNEALGKAEPKQEV